jgi:hypothetical protein
MGNNQHDFLIDFLKICCVAHVEGQKLERVLLISLTQISKEFLRRYTENMKDPTTINALDLIFLLQKDSNYVLVCSYRKSTKPTQKHQTNFEKSYV